MSTNNKKAVEFIDKKINGIESIEKAGFLDITTFSAKKALKHIKKILETNPIQQ